MEKLIAKLERSCPNCGKVRVYKSIDSYRHSKNSVCYACRRAVKYEGLKETIVKSTTEGKTIAEISDISGYSVARIHKVIEEHGLIYNRVRYNPIINDDGNLTCRTCGKIYDSKYPSSQCPKCVVKNTLKGVSSDITRFMRRKIGRLKSSCKEKGVLFRLSEEYLVDQYNKQNGACFYTGRLLGRELSKGFNKAQLSVDKIYPELGYIEGNVVLCTFQANAIKQDISLDELKQWMPGWYQRLVDKGYIKEIEDESVQRAA